jgi:serine phosphatase RsbU (regulator of sigma subunit)/ligand-binding sensor domain-containing protein
MKQLVLTLIFTVLTSQLFTQVNPNGIPFISNYAPNTYNAAEQNWSITKDNRGVMYFGNNDNGILEYDGVTWRKIPNKNNSIVRSLTSDNNGVVYAGNVSDFGQLSIDKAGKYAYTSLFNLIDSSKHDFADVWNTMFCDSSIYFGSEKYMFCYKNNTLKQYDIPLGSLFSFLINNRIYIANFNDGLLKLSNDTTLLEKGGEFFSDKGIYTLNSWGETLLVGSYPDGLFNCNLNSGKVEEFDNKNTNNFVKDYQLYSSSTYDSTQLLIGTLQNGAIVLNKKGEIKNHYNKASGLQDETIINLFTSNSKNIWLALNNGISKIEQNSPWKIFTDKNGIRGTISDICYFNKRIIVSTSLGLFYKEEHSNTTPKFIQIADFNDQTWSLLPFTYQGKQQLLIGSVNGLYTMDQHFKVKYIDKQIRETGKESKTLYIQKLSQSHSQPNKVYVALYDEVFSIRFYGEKWQREKTFPVNGSDIRHITEDKQQNIWFASYMSGIIKSSKSDSDAVTFYDKTYLPSENENFIGLIDGEIVAGTKKGLYKYNPQDNRFTKDERFSDFSASVFFFNQDKKGNLWISAFSDQKRYVLRYTKNNKGSYEKDDIPFKRLPNEQFDAIYHGNEGITWLGSSNGLYSFDNNLKMDYTAPFNTLIRKVSSNEDSVVFWGTNYKVIDANKRIPTLVQPEELKPVLDYTLNDLTFEFAAPYFIEEQRTTYSHKLEGYKDNWSKWNKETKAVYTNLNEGKYIFKAKAKNIYGVESTVAEYHFSIAPPWYKTIIAYIFYFIAAIFIIVLIVKLYTHKLEQEKIQLERIVHERTSEIRKQKEDIEQKNEILQEQKAEILEQKEEITASIQYAYRIQKAIVPNEELAECLLKNYFLLWKPRDIVSGDFWWLGEKNGYVVATAADCTGHGVPGAFMSMLGVSFLNEIVKQQDITESDEILNRLRHKVKTTLGQTDAGSTSKDGMDMGLLVIDFNKMKAQFSGAYNPLYVYRNNELIETKADRNPIAIYIKEKPFTQHYIDLQKGDTLYMFSDGFPDQFGGKKDKKYSTKRFKQLLLDNQDKTMAEQKKILNTEIEQWRGDIAQIDDIIVLGIRI